jgi:hypothetical protein
MHTGDVCGKKGAWGVMGMLGYMAVEGDFFCLRGVELVGEL